MWTTSNSILIYLLVLRIKIEENNFYYKIISETERERERERESVRPLVGLPPMVQMQ